MGEGTYLNIPARRPAPKFSTKRGCSEFFCAPERLKSGDGTEQAATSGGDVDVEEGVCAGFCAGIKILNMLTHLDSNVFSLI